MERCRRYNSSHFPSVGLLHTSSMWNSFTPWYLFNNFSKFMNYVVCYNIQVQELQFIHGTKLKTILKKTLCTLFSQMRNQWKSNGQGQLRVTEMWYIFIHKPIKHANTYVHSSAARNFCLLQSKHMGLGSEWFPVQILIQKYGNICKSSISRA